MQPTRIFTILFLFGVLLTIVLSASTWMDIDDEDENALSKRSIFHHKHHHHDQDPSRSHSCVRCKFSLVNCCQPNICVKRRLRTDKCMRVKN
jgi:hypothetical protein